MKLSAFLNELEGAREMAREESGDKDLDPDVTIQAVREPHGGEMSLDQFDVIVKNKRAILISDL